MTTDQWQIVRLLACHRRDTFDCGNDALNTYLRKFARQNDKRDIGRTFVAVMPDSPIVRGYYSLSSSMIAFQNVPDDLKKRLPKYPIPTALVARLATDLGSQGKGLGKLMLMNALCRVARASRDVGIHGVEVHAKDDSAHSFYKQYGFASLLDDSDHMFLSPSAVRKAFNIV